MANYYLYNYWDLGLTVKENFEKLLRRDFTNSFDVSESSAVKLFFIFNCIQIQVASKFTGNLALLIAFLSNKRQ